MIKIIFFSTKGISNCIHERVFTKTFVQVQKQLEPRRLRFIFISKCTRRCLRSRLQVDILISKNPKNINILFTKFFFESRYRDYRDDNGNLSAFYWELLALRFTFVIIFEVSYFFFLIKYFEN